MRGKKDEERLDALRERLYARDVTVRSTTRTPLSRTDTAKVSDEVMPESEPEHASAPRPTPPPPPRREVLPDPQPVPMPTRKRFSYRTKILLTALVFFVASIMLSSLFILFGGNSISGDNIALSVSGPFTVGGGEDLSLQVGVTNRNNVPIQSATLIVEYPDGTQSADEDGRALFIERIPLEAIGSGETVSIPLRARVYGEENETLTVSVSIEYRVTGSNATFFKEAEPLEFKISSSPVSVEIDAVENISSGQETDIVITVKSNATTPLADILVKAEFPSGFDFTESSPDPVSGQNTWLIDSLEPEEEVTVTVRGLVVGTKEEERVMYFAIGVPNERDPFNLASVFATASHEFIIEEPFLEVTVEVDGDSGESLSVEPGQASNVTVRIENSTDNTVYNGVVSVALDGNALSDTDVRVTNGFYDSNSRTVTWDSSGASGLRELAPGAVETFRFSLEPSSESLRTPQINLTASVSARRVRESSVSESLVGSARAVIKITSTVTLVSETGFGAGPVPPEVGETTTYIVGMQASAGTNDMANAVVTATLPSYVTWTGQTAGEGTFSFNAADRTVEWNIGSIDAGEGATGAFQVSILPSASQIGTTPTLVGEQRLRAEDRFTGSTLRATAPARTTTLSADAGYDKDDGKVVN